MTTEAEQLNEEARACDDDARAEVLYREAARLAPDWSVPLYNLGLLTKYQGRWADSLEFNRRAVALAPDDEAAWWNLGIAATALGDWKSAREAWTAFGIEVPPGDGPVEMKLGLTPIRIEPGDGGEVVWCERIDPARARIRSVPLPDSGRRYDDLVLHDGAPNGERRLGERLVPVFDELALLTPSTYATFEVEVRAETREELEAWFGALFEAGVIGEDWTSSVVVLCKQCSEGVVHAYHDRTAALWVPERQVAVAATSRMALERALEAVEAAVKPEVTSIELVLAASDTA